VSLQHHVPSRVYITKEELTKLVALSTTRNTVQVVFSEAKIHLDNIPENWWLFPLLAEWRGLNT
jgi:hypothetical protein